MKKFIFAYHGGGDMPSDPAEIEQVMTAWQNWFEGMGDAVVDPGNPAGPSKTVSADGTEDNGGANPITGYSIVNATDIDAAVAMARGCPILSSNGSIEVAEAIPM